MYSKTEKLGTKSYRGQKQVVVDILLAAGDPLTLEGITARAEAAGYAKLMNDWALRKVGVRGSVKYHLGELIETEQVREDGPGANPKPTEMSWPRKPHRDVLPPVSSVPAQTHDEDCLLRMARRWYGYGRWDAPYWFIGPEPGMHGSHDNLKNRCEAWMSLGGGELVDCKEHHFGFGEYEWHRDIPGPEPQPTWKKLILLLLACRNGATPSLKDILRYQQKFWGMKSAESCVIELCSLAAKGLKVKKNVSFDPTRLRKERIEEIRGRIEPYKPAYVLMYTVKHKPYWDEIARRPFSQAPDIQLFGNGRTQLVFSHHPVDNIGVKNQYWVELAERLRRSMGLPPCRETGDEQT